MQSLRLPQWNLLALANRIQPKPAELVSAQLHRASVKARLEHSFDVSRILSIGSHSRGTAIQLHSDRDLLFVLRRNEAKWGGNTISSDTIMARVLDELKGRFPGTHVRRDRQAAVIAFGQGKQSLDIVPALFHTFKNGRPIYVIPDGFGGWRQTSPETHDRYFEQANIRSGGKLRKVAQLLKWWKHSREQPYPIASFHTDLVLAASGVCAGAKPYTHCLYHAFRLLRARECRALLDPCGIAGSVYACDTDAQRTRVIAAVDYARLRCAAAIAAETTQNVREANVQWSLLFNHAY